MDCIVHGVAKSRTQLGDFHWNWNCDRNVHLFNIPLLYTLPIHIALYKVMEIWRGTWWMGDPGPYRPFLWNGKFSAPGVTTSLLEWSWLSLSNLMFLRPEGWESPPCSSDAISRLYLSHLPPTVILTGAKQAADRCWLRSWEAMIKQLTGTDQSVGRCWSTGAQVLIKERSEERRVGKECRSRWSPYH